MPQLGYYRPVLYYRTIMYMQIGGREGERGMEDGRVRRRRRGVREELGERKGEKEKERGIEEGRDGKRRKGVREEGEMDGLGDGEMVSRCVWGHRYLRTQ